MLLRYLTSPKANSTASNDTGSTTTHIVLISVSATIFVVVIGVVLYRCCRWQQPQEAHSKRDAYSMSVQLNTMTAFPPIDARLLQAKIEFSRLQYTRKLATGAFGEVWLGQLDGSYVAIKQILPERRHERSEIKGFLGEIGLMARLQHKNILRFIGFSWSPQDYNMCFCTEYLKHGDLFANLQIHKAWSWPREKIKIALDIAQGLVYLHSLTPKVIHRDLKSRNILLDDTYGAKITDFGVSRVRQMEETLTAGVGTALWAAPEVFLGRKYDDKADIYSFGIVLSELDTTNMPFADHKVFENSKFDAMVVLKLVTMEHATPNFSDDCPDSILELARRCLSFDPVNRPTAVELVEFFESVVIPELEAQTQLFVF